MGIEKLQSTKINNALIKNIIKQGRFPGIREVVAKFKEFLGNRILGMPLFRPKLVTYGEVSNVDKYNSNLESIDFDITTLYENTLNQTQAFISNITYAESERKKIEYELDFLKDEVLEMLLLSNNAAGYFSYIGTNFSSTENTDNQTMLNTGYPAHVEIGKVTLPLQKSGSKQILIDKWNLAKTSNISTGIETPKTFEALQTQITNIEEITQNVLVKQETISALSKVQDGNDNTMWLEKIELLAPRNIVYTLTGRTLEHTVTTFGGERNIGTGPVTANAIEIIPFAATPITITGNLYDANGVKIHSLTPKTITTKETWEFDTQTISKFELFFSIAADANTNTGTKWSEETVEDTDENGNKVTKKNLAQKPTYIYIFGIGGIYFLQKQYENYGEYISTGYELAKPDGSPFFIYTMTLETQTNILPNTNIDYYYSMNNNNNWQRIVDINNKNPELTSYKIVKTGSTTGVTNKIIAADTIGTNVTGLLGIIMGPGNIIDNSDKELLLPSLKLNLGKGYFKQSYYYNDSDVDKHLVTTRDFIDLPSNINANAIRETYLSLDKLTTALTAAATIEEKQLILDPYGLTFEENNTYLKMETNIIQKTAKGQGITNAAYFRSNFYINNESLNPTKIKINWDNPTHRTAMLYSNEKTYPLGANNEIDNKANRTLTITLVPGWNNIILTGYKNSGLKIDEANVSVIFVIEGEQAFINNWQAEPYNDIIYLSPYNFERMISGKQKYFTITESGALQINFNLLSDINDINSAKLPLAISFEQVDKTNATDVLYFRAVLSRNSSVLTHITPTLNSYKLRFTTKSLEL